MLSEFRKRLDELSDNFFNKETENIENNQSELKNIITKMKNTNYRNQTKQKKEKGREKTYFFFLGGQLDTFRNPPCSMVWP